MAQIASDMLLLLADHVKNFLEFYPEVPKKIVEVLARTLAGLVPPIPSPPTMARGGGAGRIGQTPRPVTNPIGEDEKRYIFFQLHKWKMETGPTQWIRAQNLLYAFLGCYCLYSSAWANG